MRRALLTLLGSGLLLVAAALLGLVGVPDDASTGLLVACLGVAGGTFVVAGRRERVAVGSGSVEWHVFAGVGDLALALAMLSTTVPELLGGSVAATSAVVGSAAGALGALALAFIGVDYLRGGVHLDVDAVR